MALSHILADVATLSGMSTIPLIASSQGCLASNWRNAQNSDKYSNFAWIFKKSSLPSSGSQVTGDCRPVTTKRLDLSRIWIMKDTVAHPLDREAIHDPCHLLFANVAGEDIFH